ncbi:glycerophosphoryl diester phosphodiesterase membrane domain-containing protein [Kitasatospora sp. NPDC088134]|uniref:glycerophosphoryl diester phosphodiesterase membrane domain-containing protein n=1 Tax=Kitasatospora sp. NPDC088134 TaxID=3364071 RepID=UPI00380D9A77
MTETPGWTSPGSPEAAPGPADSGHRTPPAGTATATAAGPGAQPAGTPAVGPIPLRPLGVGELMDGSFALVRRHWRVALGFSLGFAAFLQLVQAGVDWWIHLNGTSVEDLFSNYLTLPLALLLGTFVTGLLAPVVSAALLGRETSHGTVWAQVRPRFGALVALSLLHLLVLAVAFAAPIVPVLALTGFTAEPLLILLLPIAVLPGAWLWIALSWTAPALILEKQSVLGAFRRSWRLVRGAWWRTFGVMLLFGLVCGLVTISVIGPASFASDLLRGDDPSDGTVALTIALTGVFAAFAKTLTLPLQAVLITLLYVDRRIRREALDLELARAAGLPGYSWTDRPAAPVPGPATPPGV